MEPNLYFQEGVRMFKEKYHINQILAIVDKARRLQVWLGYMSCEEKLNYRGTRK